MSLTNTGGKEISEVSFTFDFKSLWEETMSTQVSGFFIFYILSNITLFKLLNYPWYKKYFKANERKMQVCNVHSIAKTKIFVFAKKLWKHFNCLKYSRFSYSKNITISPFEAKDWLKHPIWVTSIKQDIIMYTLLEEDWKTTTKKKKKLNSFEKIFCKYESRTIINITSPKYCR